MKFSKIITILIVSVFLGACSAEVVKFEAGDMESDFCGSYINYQYCECANKGDFCQEIAMSSGEAQEHVKELYEKWVESERNKFKTACERAGARYKKDKCRYCQEGERVVDGKCQVVDQSLVEGMGTSEGICNANGTCGTECEGNVMWQLGCNGVTNTCERTFDTDCSTNFNTYGNMQFSMVCKNGKCSRDDEKIIAKRKELEASLNDLTRKRNSQEKNEPAASIRSQVELICNNNEYDFESLDIVVFSGEVKKGILDLGFDRASTSVAFDAALLDDLLSLSEEEAAIEEGTIGEDELVSLSCSLVNIFAEAMARNEDKNLSQEIAEVEDKLNSLPNIY